ncbi:C40 family peptidase [Virgibacillus proomii]|uniref:C40 family peptidase n=1 Tax=Virgibacillus proomii TaxID=84407 RepID=UPI001C121D4E|nr:C40 family peptidase [Virgibacillus proomii]MBU5268010.1 C40 family peptidase [Virgibacillus proomii]
MSRQKPAQNDHDLWVTSVPVATVWTNPESPRSIDFPGITNPTNLDTWINQLDNTAKLALCEENRIQTQLLYGEQVVITEQVGDWVHIVIPSQPSAKDERGYPGWVPLCQLETVNRKEWQQQILAIIRSDKAWLKLVDEQKIKLSYSTILPVKDYDESEVMVCTPHGIGYLNVHDVELFSREKGLLRGNGAAILGSVKGFVGLAYFWGGMSSFGYDCSGLSYTAHKVNGYQIARDAVDQSKGGKEITFSQVQPGDLLFFAYEEGKGRLHHVGLYYGKGKMLHSPQTGKGIEVIQLKGTIYEKELCAIQRYWRDEGCESI